MQGKMSSRKLNSTSTVSSTAAYPPRRRSSGVLSSSTTGSEPSVSVVSLPPAATTVALTVKKSGTKSRAYTGYTSLAAPQATAGASSDVYAPHVSTKVPAGTSKSTSVRPRALAAIASSRTAPPPPATCESVPSLPLPAAAAAVQHAPPLSNSTAAIPASAALRLRGSSSTASATAPPAAVDVPGGSPVAANESSKAGLSTSSAGPPPPPIPKHASNHADANTNLAAAPPAMAVPRGEKSQARGSVPARGPRRLSSTSHHTDKGVIRVIGAAATPSTPAPEAAAVHADPIGASAARQHVSAPTATTSKQNGHSASATALSVGPTTASGTSSSTVAQASLKSSVSSSVMAKRKVMRRAGTGTATTSRRPSLSCTATADSATAPTRESSVVLPQSRTSGVPAPTLGVESAPSTALSTARTTGPTAASTPTNTWGAVSSSTTTRLSRGPVVSEEWARSIIKPGDEKLLYRAAAAATESGFTRTPSSISMSSAIASTAWQARTVRNLKNDTELRRAQQTVLRQRYAETPLPGWRSTKAASIGAGSAVSVASSGSLSRFGSTVKRSSTRLQHRLEEGEDRPRSFMAAVATPASENGGSLGGGCASNQGAAVRSASPTPSHISEVSTNTVKRGGSRLSCGGARPPLEQLSGSAPMSMGLIGQWRSPSLTLFTKPSPRTFSTPSPRGSFTGPELKNPLGVSSRPYCASNEELTRLTSVREEMLRTLMHSAPPPAASAATGESSAAPAVASTPNPNGEDNADVVKGFSSLLPVMNVGAQADEVVWVPPAFPPAGTRSRQRVYSIDLRSGSSKDKRAPDLQSAPVDAAQPRWRFATGGATPILASSIRQQSGNVALRARPEPPGATEAGATSGPTSTRPTLDSSVFVSGAPHAASQATPRQPRRPAVMVKLSSLQSPNVVAERARLELLRQEQQQLAAACSGQTGAAAFPSVATSDQLLTANSEAEAWRLLIDPFFPLISEENYQRLVLQNNEYNTRKELLASIRATPRTSAVLSRPCGSSPPVPPLDVGAVPRAARALEMDLEEADEPAPVRPLKAAALAYAPVPAAAAAAPLSPSWTLANAAITGSTPPRRPSVQYGDPVLCATFTPPRVPSPSSNLTSPTAGSATGLGGTTSFPARDGKLHVNAVTPTEKLGSIKLLNTGGVWVAASESIAPSTAQPFLNASLLASTAGGVAAGGTASSPIHLRSTSPTASCSSSRNVTRRSSLLRNAQQHLQLQATATSTTSSSNSADDVDSTASDEAVDLAEGELCKALSHWGPFRTSDAAAPSACDAVGKKRATSTGGTTTRRATATNANKVKKSAHGETASALSSTESIPSLLSMVPVLSPAMAEELRAYMHVFLKRYRGVDAVVAEEIGPIPETPLALQRAIRHSLRLSNGRSAGVTDEEEAVELEDPLDDGSYHSQNVQYVLDLVGSLLQADTSLCEDDAAPKARDAPLSTTAKERHNKQRVTCAEFIALVMGQSTSSSGEGMADGAAPNHIRSNACQGPTPRPMLKLRDPELRAVELMFVNGAS